MADKGLGRAGHKGNQNAAAKADKQRSALLSAKSQAGTVAGLSRGDRLLRQQRTTESDVTCALAKAPPVASVLPTFDRIIHERMRLGIVTVLAANESLAFSDLKRLLQTTDGNLSVHARKLEDAGYIACDKSFRDRVPRTEYRLTALGRKAMDLYLAEMERFLRSARS